MQDGSSAPTPQLGAGSARALGSGAASTMLCAGRRSARLIVAVVSMLAAATLPAAPATQAVAQAPAIQSEIPVERLAGPDRFATAARVSEATFAPGVEVAYVATGLAYPDALAAGPLAGRDGAPVLLVGRETLPGATVGELQRLRPGRIVVLGSAAAVSDAVVAQLEGYTAGGVSRLAGANRFATAAAISAAGFQPGVATAYVATGENFPDALAGAAAGAVTGGPVLLVRRDSVPEETRAELARLAPASIALLGGPAAVSDQVAADLQSLTGGPLRRLAGPDRFATAVAVSQDTFETTTAAVFVATGANFPDALAGAPAAAQARAPVLLVPGSCMPWVAGSEIDRLEPDRLVALGGSDVVSDQAAALTPCESAPPLSFAVDAQVRPVQDGLAPLADGQPRELARLVNARGRGADFVNDELLITTGDQAALDAFQARWDGQVLATTDPADAGLDGDPVHLVRIDPSLADPAGLVDDVRAVDPLARGHHRVSSDTGLGLLAAAAAEAADGITIGVNFVGYPDGHLQYADRVTAESPTGAPYGELAYSPNPFQWPYMRVDQNMNIGAAEAWRTLELAGALGNRVKIAVIDGGFVLTSPDFSPGSTFGAGTQNELECSGNPCPWHGSNVAAAAAAVSDNSFGTAGAAGPIGDLMMIDYDGGMWDAINAIYTAFQNGAKVINMSFSMEVDASFSFALIPFEDATQEAREQGSLVFASAGNAGEDVDAEDCPFLVACWEEEWIAPCENHGVVCVGGLQAASRYRDSRSNYGWEWCEAAPCDVDIFGPFTVYTGLDYANPSNTGNVAKNGTSFSSPFVAGVAALIWAANPGLSDDQVEQLLYATAHPGPDPQVGRYVNAYAAVLAALGGNVTPVVEITAPADGTTVGYGPGPGPGVSKNIVALRAVAYDAEDADCCAVTWTSDLDGVLKEGAVANVIFRTPGTREVTATATDSAGATATSASITITATNEPPTVSIAAPAPGETFYTGFGYTFQSGSAVDPNQGYLGCEALTWTSSDPADTAFPAGGCDPRVSFATAGTRTITLTATDAYGLTGQATVAIDVVEPPPTGPPIVIIDRPQEGETLFQKAAAPLRGTATDPDGTEMTFRWALTDEYTGRDTRDNIGTQLDMDWVPADSGVGGRYCDAGLAYTLTLYATDAAGDTSSDSVRIRIKPAICDPP